METLGSARLAEAVPSQRSVTAIVSRQEIADALADHSAPAELRLEVARQDTDGQEERSTISMSWSRGDLEKLLAHATSDKVILTFDRDELSQAVGDVEAHGLRERALVFTVAVTGALGSAAAIANAMPTGGESGAVQSTPSAHVTDVSSTGGYAAPVTVAEEAGVLSTDASSGGGYAAPPPAAEEAGVLSTDASSGGGYEAPARVSEDVGVLLTDASSGAGYAAASATASEGDSMLTDASSGGGYAPTVEAASSSGGVFDVPTPGPLETGIAGGIALAIAAAAFTTRRHHTARPT